MIPIVANVCFYEYRRAVPDTNETVSSDSFPSVQTRDVRSAIHLWAHNPLVGGSSPPRHTIKSNACRNVSLLLLN
jgi:hypothetical protein